MGKTKGQEAPMFKKYGSLNDIPSLTETEKKMSEFAQMPTPFSSHAHHTPQPSPQPIAPQPEAMDEPETTIGENIKISGSLSFLKMLRIDGIFEGELVSQGKLIIGPKGVVKSDLNLHEVYVSGTVEGDICAKERVVLRGRARVTGNITARFLSVDEGVSICGKVNVIDEPSSEASPDSMI